MRRAARGRRTARSAAPCTATSRPSSARNSARVPMAPAVAGTPRSSRSRPDGLRLGPPLGQRLRRVVLAQHLVTRVALDGAEAGVPDQVEQAVAGQLVGRAEVVG